LNEPGRPSAAKEGSRLAAAQSRYDGAEQLARGALAVVEGGPQDLRHEWFRNRTDADHSGPQDPNTIVYREEVGAVFALVGTEGVDLGLHLVVIDGFSYLFSRREREHEACHRRRA
jgi:hypothetical protein